MINAALEAAALGLRVFPLHGFEVIDEREDGSPILESDSVGDHVHSPGKQPRIEGWQRAATTDADQITEWWELWPNANVGIVTDGLLVVDFDPRNMPNPEFMDHMIEELPDTYTVQTGAGGAHLYYRDTTGSQRSGPLREGVDIKAGGGYVVGAGSLHEKGTPYAVLRPIGIVDAPSWLSGKRQGPEIEGFEDDEEKIGDGRRNGFLVWKAGQLRRVLGSTAQVAAALWQVNVERCEPPETQERIDEIATWVTSKEGVIETFAVDQLLDRLQQDADTFRRALIPLNQLRNMPPPPWVIEDVMTDVGFTIVFGAEATFKSFIMLDWTLSRAMGIPWMGHEIIKPAKTLYVAAEGAFGYGIRFLAWEQSRGVRVEDDRFGFYSQPINLARPDLVGEPLAELIMDERYEHVVFDTWARNTVGVDENSAQETGRVIGFLGRLRELTNVGVTVVHHSAGGERGNARGSTAIRGAADQMFKLTRIGDRDNLRVRVQCTKNKDAPDGWAQRVQMRLVDVTVAGAPQQSLVAVSATEDADEQEAGDQIVDELNLRPPETTEVERIREAMETHGDDASAIAQNLGTAGLGRARVAQIIEFIRAQETASDNNP